MLLKQELLRRGEAACTAMQGMNDLKARFPIFLVGCQLARENAWQATNGGFVKRGKNFDRMDLTEGLTQEAQIRRDVQSARRNIV